LFPEEEVPHILTAVLRCVAQLKKTQSNEHENHLNRKLHHALVRDADLRDRALHIDREAVVDDDKDTEGRLDLRFLYSTGRNHPWPYFALEAKRMHVTFGDQWKSLASEYVSGHQGMMCFVTGRYSPGLRSGCMLAYVFDGDHTKARAGVSDAVARSGVQLRMKPPFVLAASAVLADRPIWETRHALDNRMFVLFHLFCPV
jgi:hypothetical protein